jgi:lipopolysaccharide transport protein LptA
VIVITITTAGCAKKEAPLPKEPQKAEKAQAQSSGTAIQQKILSFNLEGLSDKGAKKWEVKGESAEVVSENEVKLDNIVAKAYGEEAEATITADKGIYDKTKNNVKLEENVKATIENTQAFAKDYSGFASGLTGSAEKEKAVSDSKKTKTVITCDAEAVFDYENNLAYFNKNVKVAGDDGNIDADKITVNLDPGTKKISQIVAEGNVKITRGENTTYSEKATYYDADKKVVLTGKPKLVIYQEGKLEENILGK